MIGLLADLPLLFAQDGRQWEHLAIAPAFVTDLRCFSTSCSSCPQQQQEKKRRAMIDGLKKNDKVLTTGGIYGTVISVDAENDKVVLRVDDERGVKLAFTRASVARVIESSSEKPAEAT